MNGSVSVVMASFNSQSYIGEAIDSILKQTRPVVEIIVSDGASTDGTVEVLRKYGDAVRVISNHQDRGPGACRNQAVAVARGDYLAFLDADDVWDPSHIDDLAGLLDRWPDAGAAFCQTHVYRGRPEWIWPPVIDVVRSQPVDLFLEIMRRNLMRASAVVVRKKVFYEAGGFGEGVEYYQGWRIFTDDIPLFLRCALNTKCILSPCPTTQYRVHDEQLNSRHGEGIVMGAYKQRILLLEQIKTGIHPPERLSLAEARLKEGWAGYLQGAWEGRRIGELRAYVRFGSAQSLLRDGSRAFFWKALVPGPVLRFANWSKQAGRKAVKVLAPKGLHIL